MTKARETKDWLGTQAETAKGNISENAALVQEKACDTWTDTVNKGTEVKDKGVDLAEAAKENISEKATEAKKIVDQKASEIKATATATWDAAKDQ